MPATKKRGPRKKAHHKKGTILFSEVAIVGIDVPIPYPQNPRHGDVDAISESLDENGMYKPLVLQKSTGYILVGNHTWKAQKREGWTETAVVYVDVDDQRAKKIVAADNRIPDLGTYDTDILGELLSSIDDPGIGTGYDPQEASLLASAALKGDEGVDLSAVLRPNFGTGGGDGGSTFMDRAFGEETEHVDLEDSDDVPGRSSDPSAAIRSDRGEFEEASDETAGVLELKDEYNFPGVGDWKIPELKQDMLLTYDELPELSTWGGSATRCGCPQHNGEDELGPERYWLYNYGIDSTSGMHDVSRCVLSFFTHDDYFEDWWFYPSRYMTKALNIGIKYALTPDFSTWAEEAPAIWLWSLYRSRWIGRYFQEVGIKVIPTITCPASAPGFLGEHVLATLPSSVPMIAQQVQTTGTKGLVDEDKKWIKHIARQTGCEAVLAYGGKKDWWDSLGLKAKVIWLPNRMSLLSRSHKKKSEADPLK